MNRINKHTYKNLNEAIINMNSPRGNLYEQWGGGTGGSGGTGGHGSQWADAFHNCLANPTNTWCLNNYDFNGDGVVDVNDLLWWLSNNGGTGGGGTGGGFAPPSNGQPSWGNQAPAPKRPGPWA